MMVFLLLMRRKCLDPLLGRDPSMANLDRSMYEDLDRGKGLLRVVPLALPAHNGGTDHFDNLSWDVGAILTPWFSISTSAIQAWSCSTGIGDEISSFSHGAAWLWCYFVALALLSWRKLNATFEAHDNLWENWTILSCYDNCRVKQHCKGSGDSFD